MASTITERNLATPDGLLQQPGLSTSVALNNYEANSEQLSGSGTLHDTVGICFQIIVQPPSKNVVTRTSNNIT